MSGVEMAGGGGRERIHSASCPPFSLPADPGLLGAHIWALTPSRLVLRRILRQAVRFSY